MSRSKLAKLAGEIERLNSKLNGKPAKNAKVTTEVLLSRRKVQTARLHLEFLRSQNPHTCATEITKLKIQAAELLAQVATVQRRIEWWENLSENWQGSVTAAEEKLEKLTAPKTLTLDELRSQVSQRIGVLQNAFAGSEATLEDLERVVAK